MYKKKNMVAGALFRLFVPEALWTRRFVTAWVGCLATVLAFDVLWCAQTTFRAMGFVGTYANAVTLALVLALPSVFSRRAWLQLVVLLLFDFLLVANLMYCRTYFNSIPLASYGLVGNVMDFTASIADSFSWIYLLLPLIALVVFLLMLLRRNCKGKPNAVLYIVTLVLMSLVSSLVSLPSGGMLKHVGYLKGECYYATTPVVVYTVFGNLVAEAMEQSDCITTAQRNEVATWLTDHSEYSRLVGQADTAVADSLAQRDNLVVIFCESLESWPVGTEVEGKELTPSLNRALRDTASTWYAPHVLSQVGNGRSIDGQLLMLAGMYPMRDFVYAMKFASNRYFALPEAMKNAGAKTYLLSGDKPSTWNQGLVAEAFGIEHAEMNDTWDNAERIGHPRRLSDNSFFGQSIEKMKRGQVWPEGEKAYVQMVTYTGHNPFRIPEQFRTITFERNEFPLKLRDYMTAVHYVDHALGQFLDYLRSRSDWERTMVVLVGDHEALASWRSELRSSPNGAGLVAEQSFVPFIILNAAVPGRHDAVMGQVDVYSTLLDQMGLPYRWRGMGFSALSSGSPTFAFDYQGNLVGDTVGMPAGLIEHVDKARAISDIIIRYDMLE